VLLMPDDRTIVLKPIKWYKNLATRKGRLEAEVFLIVSGTKNGGNPDRHYQGGGDAISRCGE